MTLRRFSTSGITTGTKSHKLWDGETFPGYFESIATVIVPSGNQSTVTFSNIPQNYAHLQVRILAQAVNATTNTSGTIRMRLQSSTNANRTHQLYASGTTGAGTPGGYSGTTTSDVAWVPYSGSGNADIFGSSIIDILDYTNTNKTKVVRALTGWDRNGGGEIVLASVLYTGTSAITELAFSMTGAGEPFSARSHFALYGIRSA